MSEQTSTKQDIAAGTSLGAAVIMVTVGIIQFFQGIAAVAENEMLVVGAEYVYKFDLTTWGWIHLVLGALVLGALVGIVGLALFTGAGWARVSAIVVAAISILANFLWLPHYPVWSLVIIALDVVVIWAVSTWNPERVYAAGTLAVLARLIGGSPAGIVATGGPNSAINQVAFRQHLYPAYRVGGSSAAATNPTLCRTASCAGLPTHSMQSACGRPKHSDDRPVRPSLAGTSVGSDGRLRGGRSVRRCPRPRWRSGGRPG